MIFSIILILKVLGKKSIFHIICNRYQHRIPRGFYFTYTFQLKLFFLLTVIYYVGNFRGYSLQLELLD